MRVNADQRKRLMAAGRFGMGPLVQMGMVKPVEVPVPVQAVLSGTPSRREGGGSVSSSAGAGKKGDTWRKLHEDDGLADLEAFLAPKRRPPAARPESAAAAPAAPAAAAGNAAAGRAGEEQPIAAAKLAVKMAPRRATAQVVMDPLLDPEEVRATASSAGARAKAAPFQAIQGPTVEEVRQLQQLHERASSHAVLTPALEAAIEALRDEELRRAKKEEKRRREEWRKAYQEEKAKRKKSALAKNPEADLESDGDSVSSDASDSLEKKRRFEVGGPVLQKMDNEQKKFWSETVKGRVSHDNKGFTDADLEQRFNAQQAASAGESLMTESEVLAMLKGNGKEKGKDKPKKKDKVKDRR